MYILFGIDMQLLMDALQFGASVFVLFLFASYLLFNPVRKLLKDRQEGIQKNISDAAADKESAKELKELYENKLKGVEKEAEQILSEARQKALKNEARIMDEAKEEAGRIIERARQEAALEKKRAIDEVKQEMVAVASMMAAKVVTASMNIQIQDTLVEETLKEMGDSTWLS